MKIITNNAVYVQKNDMMYLLNNVDLLPIPGSILMKVFGKDIVIIDDNNRYDFEKFEDDKEIEFFKGLDWIVDYNSLKNLSDDEIIEIGQGLIQTQNQIAQQYNSMSEDERKENFSMVNKYKLMDFKIYSLRDILWFRQGHLKMILPEGIEYPEGVDYSEEFVQKDKNGIQRLIKKFFPKKK